MAGEYSIPSGAEILSYRGDPGLAAGAGAGLMPIQVNPLAGVDTSLDRIQELNAKKSLIDYNQKIKDRDDLAKVLSEIGGSVFNMAGEGGKNISFSPLPEDQKVLTEKAGELRNIILKNPDSFHFNEDYLSKRKEFDNLTNHAGVRAHAYSTYNQDAAKVNDPDERAAIMNLRKGELAPSLQEYHNPEPYMPAMQTIDQINPKDWSDKKKLQDFGVKIENRNGTDYEVKKMGIPNSVLLSPLSDVTSKGIEYIKNATHGFLQLPQSKDPAFITKMNQDIDAKAAARGVNPVYAATVNPEGSISYGNQRDIATALNIEKHGFIQTEEKPSDAGIKQQKESLDMTNIKNQMKNRDALTSERWAALKEKAREWDNPHNKNKATTEELKDQRYQREALGAYKDVKAVFDNAFASNKGANPVVPSFWKEHGIDPAQYQQYSPISQKAADAFIGVPADDESTTTKNEEGDKKTTKSGRVSKTPTRVIPIENKTTGERKLVYMDGNNILSIVDEKNAIVNKLKHEGGYEPKNYENQVAWVDQIYSGTQSEAQPVISTQEAPISQSKKIGGKTYVQKNGKWYIQQ